MEQNSDDQTSDEFMVPEPPSLSGIIDGTTISSSSSSTTTDVEENFVEDDMSSLTTISDIEVSDSPRRHEFAKERVDRKGSVYNKLYNASLKGQLSSVREIIEKPYHSSINSRWKMDKRHCLLHVLGIIQKQLCC